MSTQNTWSMRTLRCASSRSIAGLSFSNATRKRCISPGSMCPVLSRSYILKATACPSKHIMPGWFNFSDISACCSQNAKWCARCIEANAVNCASWQLCKLGAKSGHCQTLLRVCPCKAGRSKAAQLKKQLLQSAFSGAGALGWKTLSALTNSSKPITSFFFVSKSSNTCTCGPFAHETSHGFTNCLDLPYECSPCLQRCCCGFGI